MRRMLHLAFTSLMTITLMAGCPSREVAEVIPSQDKVDGPIVPVEIRRNIDILFVIDNSGSMAEEQASLVANFPGFIEVLQNIEGGLPNVHIGVVTTDVGAGSRIQNCNGNGDNGRLQNMPKDGTCEGPSDAYIMDIADPDNVGQRITNYTDTQSLAQTFSCIAELGTQGCGFEQPLESAFRALRDVDGNNAGFIREDAFLALIIISDEDDCSTEDARMFSEPTADLASELGPLDSFRCHEFGVVCEEPGGIRDTGGKTDCKPRNDSTFMYSVDRYVQFLQNELGKDRADIIVAGIIGDPTAATSEPDPDVRAQIRRQVQVVSNQSMTPPRVELAPWCQTEGSGVAQPAIRLQSFLEAFTRRNTLTTICNDDLTDALVLVANLLAEVIGNPCMKGDIDLDPDTSGIQEECVVSDVRFPDTEDEQETLIRKCSSSPPASGEVLPCWHLVDEETCTGDNFPSGKALVIERGDAEVPSGTFFVGECRIK